MSIPRRCYVRRAALRSRVAFLSSYPRATAVAAHVGLFLLVLGLAAGAPARGLAQTGGAQDTVGVGGKEIIRPGDSIRLRIWREPDLSGDFAVDAGGVATLPRLGPVNVGAMTPDSLHNYLLAGFAKYIRNPTVEVTVLRRITVLGAVRNPGVYSADPTMTVAEVLALAGGVSVDGKRDRIQLIRNGAPLDLRLAPGAHMANTALRSGDQIYVPQRSWLSRNFPWVIGVTLSLTGLALRLAR
jgi:protein involved in polysaccharide export with SLBB domain